MPEKENQRVIVTKRMLKEGLLRLMKKKCIQSISVSELCKEAGINRVTFYNHYSVPNDILAEMGNELISGLQVYLKENRVRPHISLQERVELACNYLQENKEIAKVLFQNNTPESEFAAKLVRGQEEWKTACTELGVMYGEDGKDLLLTFMVHGAYCMITKWLLDDIKKTPKELGSLIGGININGFTL